MGIGIKELLVILVVVLIVFGTKRLKNAGGDLGEAIKGFRKAMREGEDEAKSTDNDGIEANLQQKEQQK